MKAGQVEHGGCQQPHKTAYENRAAAVAALRRMDRSRTRGVHPYPCPGGRHWHLGRRLRPGFSSDNRKGARA